MQKHCPSFDLEDKVKFDGRGNVIIGRERAPRQLDLNQWHVQDGM